MNENAPPKKEEDSTFVTDFNSKPSEGQVKDNGGSSQPPKTNSKTNNNNQTNKNSTQKKAKQNTNVIGSLFAILDKDQEANNSNTKNTAQKKNQTPNDQKKQVPKDTKNDDKNQTKGTTNQNTRKDTGSSPDKATEESKEKTIPTTEQKSNEANNSTPDTKTEESKEKDNPSTEEKPNETDNNNETKENDNSTAEQNPNENENENAPEPVNQDQNSQNSADSEVISIDNFDPNNPKKINDPHTITAMRYLGIVSSELCMPTEKEINDIKDEELQDIFVKHHQQRINRLIDQIKSERSTLLYSDSAPSTGGRNSRPRTALQDDQNQQKKLSSIEDPSLALEKRHFERQKQQRKRDIEQLVATILIQEKMREDMISREQRSREVQEQQQRIREEKAEMARMKYERKLRDHQAAEAEVERQKEEFRQRQFEKEQQQILNQKMVAEERLQKMREYEELHLQRVQRNRDSIQKLQEERALQLRQKEMENQAKEIMFLEKKQQENNDRNEKARQEFERKQKLLLKIRTNEKNLQEAMKRDLENHIIEQEQQYEHFTQTQHEKRELFKKSHDDKLKRYTLKKEQIEQETNQRNLKLLNNDEYMTQRVLLVEKMKEKERQKKTFIMKLKKEERDQNALHVKRQDDLRMKNTQQRLLMKQQISEKHEHDKMLFYRKRNQTLISMERDKKQMDEDFNRQIAENSLSPQSILKITKKYSVDLNSIYRKINGNNNRRAASQAGSRNVKIQRVATGTNSPK